MGFVKIIKDPFSLVSIIKNFLESFINFYLEEIIFGMRTINKKKITSTMCLSNYQLKYIKAFDCRIKDRDKSKK
jgi:hypothetical protein